MRPTFTHTKWYFTTWRLEGSHLLTLCTRCKKDPFCVRFSLRYQLLFLKPRGTGAPLCKPAEPRTMVSATELEYTNVNGVWVSLEPAMSMSDLKMRRSSARIVPRLRLSDARV